MTSPDVAGREPAEQVSLCLSAAAVNRVASVVPIFFGRLAGLSNTDSFDVNQGVEMLWRELGGHPRSESLRHEVQSRIPDFRRMAVASAMRGSMAVVSALDAIAVLVIDSVGSRERIQTALQAALGVAIDFDLLGVASPAGHSTWMGYELHGQAELLDSLPVNSTDVSGRIVYDLRMRSGVESMNYMNSMEALVKAST